MTTRKPDWAQRMVDNAMLGIPTYMAVRTNYQDCPAEYEPKAVVLAIDYEKYAATILRAHHRKVKRVVLEVGKDFSWSTSVASAIRDILDKLEELER